MPYCYADQRANLFTDEGQRLFIKARDTVRRLCLEAGACRSGAILSKTPGTFEGWNLLACLDRMIELGELREITGPDVSGQDRVFVLVGRAP